MLLTELCVYEFIDVFENVVYSFDLGGVCVVWVGFELSEKFLNLLLLGEYFVFDDWEHLLGFLNDCFLSLNSVLIFRVIDILLESFLIFDELFLVA